VGPVGSSWKSRTESLVDRLKGTHDEITPRTGLPVDEVLGYHIREQVEEKDE